MRPELTIVHQGASFGPYREGTIRIGRNPSCDVLVDSDRSVSREHVIVTAEIDGWVATNVGTHGMFVGGQRVERVEVRRPTSLRLASQTGPEVRLEPAAVEAEVSTSVREEVPGGTIAAPDGLAATVVGGGDSGGGESLVIRTDRTRRVADPGERIVVGRESGADVPVDDPRVSRLHGIVEHSGGRWTFHNEGRRGTYGPDGRRVDDVTVTGPTTLRLADPRGPEIHLEPLRVAVPDTPGSRTSTRLVVERLRRTTRRTQIGAGVAIAAAIAIGVFVVTTGSSPTPAERLQDVVRDVTPSTVFIDDGVGSGSGWVWDADAGLIVTNNHVAGGAATLGVRMSTESELRPAELVGAAPCDDLAVLRVSDTHGLVTIPRGSQSDLEPLDDVVVIGFPANASSEDEIVYTVGAVSVVKTSSDPDVQVPALPDVVQVQAPINSGNSGGPLVDLDGKLVGVNTFNISSREGQNYAIGVDRVNQVVPQLVGGSWPSWVGIMTVTPDEIGLRITDGQGNEVPAQLVLSVAPGSPAEQAGISAGYLITKIDGLDFGRDGMAAYCSALGDAASGSSHAFTVIPGTLSKSYDWSSTGGERDVSVILP